MDTTTHSDNLSTQAFMDGMEYQKSHPESTLTGSALVDLATQAFAASGLYFRFQERYTNNWISGYNSVFIGQCDACKEAGDSSSKPVYEVAGMLLCDACIRPQPLASET